VNVFYNVFYLCVIGLVTLGLATQDVDVVSCAIGILRMDYLE